MRLSERGQLHSGVVASVMMEINRFTTQYDPMEDRIRLTGADDRGQTLSLWLTQRLLNRLVPHLCVGLEKRFGAFASKGNGQSLSAHVVQSFAQEKARTALPRSRPVVPTVDAPQWRVETVDVKNAPGGVRLTLKGPTEAEQASLVLSTPAQRQWLGIVYEQYRCASWPMQVWPHWMVEAAGSPPRAVPGVLH